MKHFRLLVFCILPALWGEPATVPGRSAILSRTAASADRLWGQLSSVNCIETVDQVKLAANGKVQFRQQQAFDYLAILQLTGNQLMVDESREPIVKAEGAPRNLPLLVTNGFSMFAFIFHPHFQNAFEYSEPVASADGLWQVQFRHVAGARSPSLLKLRKREYPLAWKGTAWIDPASGSVVRILASLQDDMEDAGLKVLQADVRYSPVHFAGQPELYWLPEQALVEVETPHQHWRNLHKFTKYRLFSVDVNSAISAPGEGLK